MKRTTLAVSTLVLAVGLAAPAVGQVDEQVARGATVTRQFCTNHKAMRDALVVSYAVGGGGKSALPTRFVRRPATNREAIGRLATVHDRLMLALRGEKRDRFIPVSIGKPGQVLMLRPAPAPSAELVQASLTNVNSLCDLHRMLHQAFAAGKPTDIRSLRGQIQTAGPNCPHGA
ncbi:MAG TPA: hypothetical protein VJ816_03880 [Gemmatimonadales bacterium]|nr:hypothetical protein [Gemmatimonadales bacterium]